MGKFFVRSKETTGPEDWRKVLADPGKHWKTGYSAKTLAYCWEEASGFPKEVEGLFESSTYPPFKHFKLLRGDVEFQVPLPGGSRGSFSDIMALAKSEYARAAIAVEGKVSETFGGLVKERTTNLSINSGVPERINFLKTQLGLGQSYEGSLQQVRYQLLHRAASALIEAERIGANAAVMLVHSFSQTDEHLGDYQAFVELFDTEGGVNTVSYAGNKNGVDLYLGWVRGEETFLHR